MPMPSIEELPEYRSDEAAYLVARRTAEQAGDRLGALEAENRWATRRLELMQQAQQQADRRIEVDAARAKAKAEYPQAPAASYESLSDPAAILAAAQAAHEAIGKVIQPQTSWGNPPAGATSPPAEPQNPDEAFEKRRQELIPEVVKGKAGARQNEELKHLWYQRAIGSRFNPQSPWARHEFPSG